MVYKFFDKKTSGKGIKNDNISNKQLPGKLHKPVIKKFNKRKVQSRFIEDIWGADLADMQLYVNLIKDLNFYCALLIFIANYQKWVIPIKDKKALLILILFKTF